jgi:hypothetical protein
MQLSASMDASPVHPGPLSRRSALRAGAVGILGLGLEDLLRLQAANPAPAKARSVVYVFLSGGLAQHETFDMKPDAPAEVRGEFSPIRTNVTGIHISEHLPLLARQAHRYALVRSLTHPSNDHSRAHHIMLTGRSEIPLGFDPNKPKDTDFPSLAALATATLPRRNNLPPAIVLPDKIVHRTGRTIPGQFSGQLGRNHEPWFLEMSPYHPADYGAFPEYLFHHEKGSIVDPSLRFLPPHLNLPQGLNAQRVLDRSSLLSSLEGQSQAITQAVTDTAFDRYRSAALGLITDPASRDAFDIGLERKEILERYGQNSFGWSLVMARRLVEAGMRLVQVNLGNNETWDTHQAAFPNLKNHLLPPLDRALSAFLDDLDSRCLLSETLVVVGSEFGRTPRISKIPSAKLPGRDHWGASQTVLLAGGGVRGGNVIGATDKIGAYPAESPQRPENLAATIFEALGLPRFTEWQDSSSRPRALYEAEPISGLT